MQQILFTGKKKVELVSREQEKPASNGNLIGGKTLFSLVSAGTELHYGYLNLQNNSFPITPGYAAVFEVDDAGDGVEGFRPGDLVFCCGNHRSYQLVEAENAVRIPKGVTPEAALFSRMAGVSMATLSRTGVRPGGRVLVTGLGAVGILAMQAYYNCGYDVTGIEPDERRAEAARQVTGLPVWNKLEEPHCFHLALECSGTQQAVATCCAALCDGGELSLVGVPWNRTGAVDSFSILNPIFYQYLKVYSGWEMNLPMNAGRFAPVSQCGNFRLALEWMRVGKMRTQGLYGVYPCIEAQAVYDAIFEKKTEYVSSVLDWRECR